MPDAIKLNCPGASAFRQLYNGSWSRKASVLLLGMSPNQQESKTIFTVLNWENEPIAGSFSVIKLGSSVICTLLYHDCSPGRQAEAAINPIPNPISMLHIIMQWREEDRIAFLPPDHFSQPSSIVLPFLSSLHRGAARSAFPTQIRTLKIKNRWRNREPGRKLPTIWTPGRNIPGRNIITGGCVEQTGKPGELKRRQQHWRQRSY